MLCALGLFTMSWDRLANIGLGPYNVKLPVVLLTVAALLLIPEWWLRGAGWVRARGPLRWLVLVAIVMIVLYSVRALFVSPITAGLAQVVALGTGAVAPALAVIGVVRSRADVVWALRWVLAGAVVAGLFGLWQLIAFYTGLPQLIAYTGVGTSGEGGRIAAFNYEPAYFAYFLVLVVACRVALARLTGMKVGWWSIGFFGVLLTLVNARSLLFLLPVLALLLAVAWRAHRALLLRGVVAAVVLGALSFAVPSVLDALPRGQAVASSVPSSTTVSAEPSATPEPSDAGDAGDAGDSSPTEVAPPQLPTNVFDPNEQSSNAPRLDLYKAVLRVDLDSPLLGVGAGGLRDALARSGYVAPNQGLQVVANNEWLQAAADGGVPLLVLELAFVVLVAVLWWRARRDAAAQPLLAGWLTVLLVGGMLTSYYFDLKLWIVLGLALAAITTADADDSDQAVSASS
ncbi:O-antigen ligase family protein [Amnibacterium kyonggiense]|uniref:O-antigen ligase-like membrane protein n=1 Tax=Amnibacterium kyonggiense TaxID=595671 RepID=A0A4R7FIX7_9MICO|nr:O-antigen ligase family protein [Amnibacterium kyonggiense]TDS74952.1 O-antigen ligase-like membrane protein [Amnibacterium kyonggiense]